MKKTRSHQGCEQIDLYPLDRTCPECGAPLVERYRQSRYIVTLSGMRKLNKHVLGCPTPECKQAAINKRPESEGALVLPRYTFGLDVVARIGELRYREHRTITQIASDLNEQNVRISIKEVQLLSEVFLALVETVVSNDPETIRQLQDQGGIILAADGVQPEKGNETLWLFRDVLSGRVLAARNLLSSSNEDLAPIVAEIKKIGVPILGVISDKQASMCLAFEKELPNVPHQLCQFHYLRDLAKPVCEADRKLKKQLKQKVRGIRDVERKAAKKQDDEAQITRGYCIALREVLRDDGKYPLDPAGITLYDKLTQIEASLSRMLAQRASAKLQRLRTILQIISTMTTEYARLVIAWSWVHQIAKMLDQGSSRIEAETQLLDYAAGLPQGEDAWLNEVAAHFSKLTKAFSPKLFAFFEQPLLPKTNNDLEVFIGQLKKDRRKATGRKDTTAFILREGRAVALLSSLPVESNWQAAFGSVDIAHFQKSLAALRCADQRSQAWQARRDLQAYLAHLERKWEPTVLETTPVAAPVE